MANGAGLKWINVNCKKQCLRQTKPDCSWPLANIDSLSLENPLIYFFHFISDYHFKIGWNILKQRRGPPFSSHYSGFHLNVSLFPNAVFKEASPGQQPPRWWVVSCSQRCVSWSAASARRLCSWGSTEQEGYWNIQESRSQGADSQTWGTLWSAYLVCLILGLPALTVVLEKKIYTNFSVTYCCKLQHFSFYY